jgi:hypothetical protein
MKLKLAIVAALVTTSAAPPGTPPAPKPVPELAGRIAGKPQRCIAGEPGLLFRTSDSDGQLLLYDDGKTIWASSLGPDCGFGPSETVIPDASASYYCKGDFVRAGSAITIFPGRRCVLANFTPWRAK